MTPFGMYFFKILLTISKGFEYQIWKKCKKMHPTLAYSKKMQ